MQRPRRHCPQLLRSVRCVRAILRSGLVALRRRISVVLCVYNEKVRLQMYSSIVYGFARTCRFLRLRLRYPHFPLVLPSRVEEACQIVASTVQPYRNEDRASSSRQRIIKSRSHVDNITQSAKHHQRTYAAMFDTANFVLCGTSHPGQEPTHYPKPTQ